MAATIGNNRATIGKWPRAIIWALGQNGPRAKMGPRPKRGPGPRGAQQSNIKQTMVWFASVVQDRVMMRYEMDGGGLLSSRKNYILLFVWWCVVLLLLLIILLDDYSYIMIEYSILIIL